MIDTKLPHLLILLNSQVTLSHAMCRDVNDGKENATVTEKSLKSTSNSLILERSFLHSTYTVSFGA